MNGSMVVVTGASGGVGASSLAAAVAGGLARESKACLLVDLDLAGGGVDVTCGVEHLGGLRWPDLSAVRGTVEPRRLLEALPAARGCAVLSAGPSRRSPGAARPAERAVRDVLLSLAEGPAPVVIDLPRWGADTWRLPADPWLLITGTRTRELADLDALVAAIENGPVGGSLTRCLLVTAGPEPDAGLVAAIEDHVGVAHAGHIARDRGVSAAAERGEWPSHRSFRPVVRTVLDRIWRRGAA